MSLSRNQLNEYLSHINIAGRRVLDVGVQDKPTKRLTQGEPKSYKTLDIDPQWSPDIVGDLNDPNLTPILLSESQYEDADGTNIGYDVIFCIEVLEHCWNPVQAVANLSQAMKHNGDLYISTPFINPHHDKVDYLRFTNEWYRDTLPRLGLTITEIVERRATAGRTQLAAFYGIEGLRVSKIRPEYGNYTYPIGYIVHATKGVKP